MARKIRNCLALPLLVLGLTLVVLPHQPVFAQKAPDADAETYSRQKALEKAIADTDSAAKAVDEAVKAVLALRKCEGSDDSYGADYDALEKYRQAVEKLEEAIRRESMLNSELREAHDKASHADDEKDRLERKDWTSEEAVQARKAAKAARKAFDKLLDERRAKIRARLVGVGGFVIEVPPRKKCPPPAGAAPSPDITPVPPAPAPAPQPDSNATPPANTPAPVPPTPAPAPKCTAKTATELQAEKDKATDELIAATVALQQAQERVAKDQQSVDSWNSRMGTDNRELLDRKDKLKTDTAALEEPTKRRAAALAKLSALMALKPCPTEESVPQPPAAGPPPASTPKACTTKTQAEIDAEIASAQQSLLDAMAQVRNGEQKMREALEKLKGLDPKSKAAIKARKEYSDGKWLRDYGLKQKARLIAEIEALRALVPCPEEETPPPHRAKTHHGGLLHGLLDHVTVGVDAGNKDHDHNDRDDRKGEDQPKSDDDRPANSDASPSDSPHRQY